MSSHADKTLHRKIYNINDTDTFSPYPFFKNVIFAHEFVHEFMREFVRDFSRISCTNLSLKILRIQIRLIVFTKIGYVTNGLYCMCPRR